MEALKQIQMLNPICPLPEFLAQSYNTCKFTLRLHSGIIYTLSLLFLFSIMHRQPRQNQSVQKAKFTVYKSTFITV